MISSKQIRAARALLDWSQKELSRVSDISELSIVNLENDRTAPQKSTLKKVMDAFELYGIGFTEDGVEERENVSTIRHGDKWYLSALEDVELTLANLPPDADKEFILIFPNEQLSPPPVIEKIRELYKQGIKQRLLIKENNTFIASPLSWNRYIPVQYFDDSRLIHCYADKIAIMGQSRQLVEKNDGPYSPEDEFHPAQVTIIRNQELANLIRSIVNVLWDILPQPTKSTADYFFETNNIEE